ncbi:MAG: YkgJ family cysteine cluster protein [Hespellia sp.]|nr:YkgJ family cysteine cluster protein [Hespellia sp.]
MDDRIEDFLELKIEPDEKFKFHCTQCGDCCSNREDILLSPQDLFRISKKLNMKPETVLMAYAEAYIGDNSRLPIVRLLPAGANKRCSLLDGCKCVVHDAKPAMCAMFPIGRILERKDGKTSFIFCYMNPKCGDDSEVHTVREWFESFGIPLDDPYFKEWSQCIVQLSESVQKIEPYCEKEKMMGIWVTMINLLYLKYDIEQPFIPQFRNNCTKMLELMHIAVLNYGPETEGEYHGK